MKTRNEWTRGAATGLAVVLAAYAAPALAQQAKGGIEEVVVTAQKREESLSKVGLTVKAIGAEELQQTRVSSLQDLAAAVPGLAYTQTESATPVYTLRGIGFYDASLAATPAVSVYVDQAPLPFPVESTLALYDLERVEVLKGPQGTLFGQNATGGAINYIAAKPTWDGFHAGVSATYARFNTFSTDSFVSGPVTDKLALRAALSTSNGDGWQKSVTRGDKNGAPDNIAGRFLADWKPTDRLRVQANLTGWHYGTEPEQGQFVQYIPSYPAVFPPGKFKLIANSDDDPRHADWTTGDFAPKSDDRLFQGTLRVDYDLTDMIVLTSITSYTDYKQVQAPIDTGLDAFRSNIYREGGHINNQYQEIRISQNKSPNFRWTIGGNAELDRIYEEQYIHEEDDTSSYTDVFFGVHGNKVSDTWSRQAAQTYAGFGNAEYTIGQLTFKGGMRYTEYHRYSQNCTFAIDNDVFNGLFGLLLGRPAFNSGECFNFNSITLIPGAFQGRINEHNLSWRAGLDWKPADNLLAYVNVAKGYKSGSFPTFTGSTQISFQPAKQEAVLTYEVGLKTQFFGRRLLVNATMYHSDYDNKQIKSKLPDAFFGPLNALVNIPKSEIDGIELEVSARPTERLTVGGSMNFIDAKLTNTLGPSGLFYSNANVQGNFDGNAIPYTAKWVLTGNFNYTFPLGVANGFVGSQILYRSRSNASIGQEDFMTIPSYYTIDVQAGADFADGKYRLMFWGKNVTNEFYLTNRNFSFDGLVQFAGMPMTYGVTLSAKF